MKIIAGTKNVEGKMMYLISGKNEKVNV